MDLVRIRAGPILGLLFLVRPGRGSRPRLWIAGARHGHRSRSGRVRRPLPRAAPAGAVSRPAGPARDPRSARPPGGVRGTDARARRSAVVRGALRLRRRGRRASPPACARRGGDGVTAAAVAVGLAGAGSSASEVASYTLTIVAIGAMMAAFASATRTNRELRQAREEIARLAVSEERLRISRDLHDLLGHSLSVIALKSELATKLLESDPDRARAEMSEVAERDPTGAERGTRSRARVPAARVRRRARRRPRGPLRGGCRLSRPDRHSRSPRRCRERVGVGRARGDDERRSPQRRPRVLDHALRRCRRRRASGGGRRRRSETTNGDGTGLAGLAERARRLQGTLEAGARPEGGFRLRLTLPLRAS